MSNDLFAPLVSRIRRIEPVWTSGEIVALSPMGLEIEGLGRVAALGDAVGLPSGLTGDILTMSGPQASVMVDGPMQGLRLGQRVRHLGPRRVAPCDNGSAGSSTLMASRLMGKRWTQGWRIVR